MILLTKIHYLLLLAFITLNLAMFIRIFIQTNDFYYSIKGVLFFIIMSFHAPFSISNEIYRNRKALTDKVSSDERLKGEQRDRVKMLINSRSRLYYVFITNHILRFSDFIEAFSRSYVEQYKNEKHKNTPSFNDTMSANVNNLPDMFDRLIEKTI